MLEMIPEKGAYNVRSILDFFKGSLASMGVNSHSGIRQAGLSVMGETATCQVRHR
jgi:hypothetical protein